MPDVDRLAIAPDITGPAVVFRTLPPGHQWSLRARKPDIEAAAAAWCAPLDLEPLTSSSLDGHHALKLGPDEWLLLAGSSLAANRLVALARTVALSLVDISDREMAWEISGDNAARVLAAGCPLDLSDASFPPGRATRTIYGQAEVILWRPGTERLWQIRIFRSFSAYLTGHLAQAVSNL